MAEFVEIDLEKSLGELHGLLDIDLFEKSEISKINEQRRSNSYSLQKKSKDKEDFLRFFRYEEQLLKRIAEKREQTGNTQRVADIDGKIKNRLHTFFRFNLERFKADVELWKDYFLFCERHQLKRLASKMLTRMLQMHGDKPDLWLFASRWAVNREENSDSDVESGRVWLVRGIERHPKNEELFKELIKYDLELSKDEENAEQRETALACAEVSYKNAIKSVRNVKFFVDLKNLVAEYPHAEELNRQAMTLVEGQEYGEDAWNDLALMQLQKGEPGFSRCAAVFDKACETLPTAGMWRKYVDFMRKHSHGRQFLTNKFYQEVLPTMIEDRLCVDQDIVFLANHKLSHGRTKGALNLLKKGHDMFPDSALLVYEYFRILIAKEEDDRVYDEILPTVNRLKNAECSSVVRIWSMLTTHYIETYRREVTEEIFSKCACGLRRDVAEVMNIKYLRFRLINFGITSVRDLLKNPKITFPPSLKVYKEIIRLEATYTEVNANLVRQHYETTIRLFGEIDADLWLNYITFEKKQKNFERVPQIHAQAMATLNRSQIELFTNKYSLQF